MHITTAEAVELHINWRTLRKVLHSDITVCETVLRSMADYPNTVARQEAKIEALRQVLATMDTLEGYPVMTDPDDDHSSDGSFRYPVNPEPDRRPLLHLNRHDLTVLANSGDADALAEWQARENGEAERIGETFDQAATDYARTEREG